MRRASTITHHSRVEDRHPALGKQRKEIEALLQASDEPLTPTVICSRSGIERAQVTIILQRLRQDSLAVNVGTPTKPRWRWKSNPASLAVQSPFGARIDNKGANGTYDGAELRPFTLRPGAMDFKKWPSRGLG